MLLEQLKHSYRNHLISFFHRETGDKFLTLESFGNTYIISYHDVRGHVPEEFEETIPFPLDGRVDEISREDAVGLLEDLSARRDIDLDSDLPWIDELKENRKKFYNSYHSKQEK